MYWKYDVFGMLFLLDPSREMMTSIKVTDILLLLLKSSNPRKLVRYARNHSKTVGMNIVIIWSLRWRCISTSKQKSCLPLCALVLAAKRSMMNWFAPDACPEYTIPLPSGTNVKFLPFSALIRMQSLHVWLSNGYLLMSNKQVYCNLSFSIIVKIVSEPRDILFSYESVMSNS